jgi:hypothetical protein
MSWPGIGNRTRASAVGGEHPRIEPFEELVKSYSEHPDMSPRQLHIFKSTLIIYPVRSSLKIIRHPKESRKINYCSWHKIKIMQLF